MSSSAAMSPVVAIACGGTGGHLFPGLAVAAQIQRRGGAVVLLTSTKEIDRQGLAGVAGMEVFALPAVGLQNRNYAAFVLSFLKSYFAARRIFSARRPQAVLAMGGFTGAPPVLAGRRLGAKTFLHESNTVPGRANRWLAPFVDGCFTGFAQAGARLKNHQVVLTGTPVRPQFQPGDPARCRAALGLEPDRPVLLVTGGSQGAAGINELVLRTLPLLAKSSPQWQLFHLAGPADAERIRRAAAQHQLKAAVHSFFAEMDLALGAATVAVSRAGASSLAELAAMRVPSILIPFPAATDDHQLKNARAFEESGAARVLEQKSATPERLAGLILELGCVPAARQAMQAALARWHAPAAAERIAEHILAAVAESSPRTAPRAVPGDALSGGSKPDPGNDAPCRRSHAQPA